MQDSRRPSSERVDMYGMGLWLFGVRRDSRRGDPDCGLRDRDQTLQRPQIERGHAMRRANAARLDAIWQVVRREPGIRSGGIARKIGIPRSSVTRALPALDDVGMLLSEDRRGGLWPWRGTI